jgi:predicted deacylase
VLLLAVSCAHSGSVVRTPVPPPEEAVASFAAALRAAEEFRVPDISVRRFTHDELWHALGEATRSESLNVEELGHSLQGRAIRAVTFGRGPTRVLLWSQMHGDESTATMALVDLIHWFTGPDGDPARDRIREELTVVMVPMLNPDGAELFQRRNAVGVDVNRDARRSATPEARILREFRDRFQPHFGFNLHDQNAHTLAGRGGPRAAIALLAPAYDAERSYNPTRSAARSVAATIAAVLAVEIPGRIARYDDAFNPRAFGDLMQQWGTSTVLVESGVLDGDPEKQHLRAINFAAIRTALESIARDSYPDTDIAHYEGLPVNRGFTYDILIREARVVFGDSAPLRLDVALSFEDPIAGTGLTLGEVGDLREAFAFEVIDAAGLFLHPGPGAVADSLGGAWLLVGEPVSFLLREGPQPDSPVVRKFESAGEPPPAPPRTPLKD